MTGEAIIDNNGHLVVMKEGHVALVGKNGIGDCVCCAGPLLIWMIIDEDEAAYGGYTNQGYCGCYESEDTEELQKLYKQYPLLNGVTVCNRIARPANDSWYVHAQPPGVRFRDWSRPPSLETLKNDFLSDIKRFEGIDSKIYFYTIVDNSGSMTTSVIQPNWGQFLTWLSTDFSSGDERFVQVHTTSSGFPERWILFIQEQMNSYINEMQLKPQSLMMAASFMSTTSATPIPGTHDISAWRDYRGPYCKWMRDTGILAPGNCLSNYVQCMNPDCPVGKPNDDGSVYWKTRFCNPENCRFFAFEENNDAS